MVRLGARDDAALGFVNALGGTVEPLDVRVLVEVQPLEHQALNKEFELPRTLASEPRRVFAKDELLRSIWGYRSPGSTRTLDSHACRLRAKLGVHGDRFIVNVWGVGYRLVDWLENQAAREQLAQAS